MTTPPPTHPTPHPYPGSAYVLGADGAVDIERIDLHDFYGLLTNDEREIWRAWCRHHGIDPNHVVVTDGWIERRVSERQIRYIEPLLNEQGKMYIDKETGDIAKREGVVQLESKPSEFPAAEATRFFPPATPQDTRPVSFFSLPAGPTVPGNSHRE